MAISAVQRVSKGFSGVTSCSIGSGDGWATPTSGNLIVLTVNGDQTFSTPSGYTAGPSVVDDNAVYLFWKISAGTETTPTITPAGTTTAVMTACEYSGVAASPADGSNTSSIVNAVGTTTTSTSVTTTAAADLIVAVAGLAHYSAGVAAPTSPTWTNSFTNQISIDVGAATSNHASTFYAELLPAGAAGAYSTSCSWTTGMLERQELLAAFKAAAVTASATPEPLVVSTPATTPVPRPTILRSTLQDPPVLTTPSPIVVTTQAPRAVANRGYILRNTLADPPVLTTPQPVVVTRPATFTQPNQALQSRSSLADVVIVTQATPAPLIVSEPATPVRGTPPIIGRNTLQDPPVSTTPTPFVVSQPVRPAPVTAPTILRSSLQDFATPAPLVVVPPPVKPWNAPPLILRSSLADPIVVTGVATPQPLVVTSPMVWPWTYRPVMAAGGVPCDCTTHRPSTGVLARPNTGTTTRPDTGVTADPCC